MSKLKLTLKEPDIDNRLLDERGPTKEWTDKARGSPINNAVERRQINRTQYAAAQKFYAHWFKSGLCEHFGTIDLARVFGGEGSSAGMPKTELQAFHRSCYRRAVEYVGKNRAWLLTAVVCHEEPVVDMGHCLGFRDRETALGKALTMLRESLDILAKEWGLE